MVSRLIWKRRFAFLWIIFYDTVISVEFHIFWMMVASFCCSSVINSHINPFKISQSQLPLGGSGQKFPFIVWFENWTYWVLYNEWLFAVYVALWSFSILKFRFLLLRVFPKQWPFSSNAIGNIQFTSGTTGMPKAAALSHYNLVNSGLSMNMHCNRIINNWNTDSIICNVLPLYHVFGFVFGSICGAILNASRNGISIRSSDRGKVNGLFYQK